MNTLDEALRTFRQALPAASRTADAIDRHASLAELSRHAAAEGLHPLAGLLFEAQQAEPYGYRESDAVERVLNTLRRFPHPISAASRTTAALERRASWEEIAKCAEGENLRQHLLAAVLCAAQRDRLRRPLIVHAPVHSPAHKRSLRWSPYRWQR